MSARHELAKVIATEQDAINKLYDYEMERVSGTILAAGYRKPRTITTAEELDALPGGSIVRDSLGLAWQKYNRPISDKPAWFAATRDTGFYFSSNFIDSSRAPLTVLHEPTP